VVGLGPSVGLGQAAATIRRPKDTPLVAARVASASELPDRWWGYEGVDRLVLTTSDEAFLKTLTSDQRQAIVQWVLLGGRMILCAGRQGESVAASDSDWVPLVPGEFVETEPLRERSGLEIFTKSELPFDEPNFQRNRPYVTRL